MDIAQSLQTAALSSAFSGENPVNIVLAADDNYVPYLGAMLYSLGFNAGATRPYDMVVLTDSISAANQEKLIRMMAAFKKRISLRFLDMGSLVECFSGIRFYGHFRVQTYYRLFMQELFPQWDKVLYLDSDMVVDADVAPLFDTDVAGVLLAAVRDADTAGIYNGFEPGRKAYMDQVLGLDDPYAYFQAGMLVCNLAEFRRRIRVGDMIDYACTHDLLLFDQDVLNVFCQGAVRYVDARWNVMMDWQGIRITDIISRAPEDLQLYYFEGRRHPAVIHFAGPEKPWKYPLSDMARYFWRYAEETPWGADLWAPFAAEGDGIRAHWRRERISMRVLGAFPARVGRWFRMRGSK